MERRLDWRVDQRMDPRRFRETERRSTVRKYRVMERRERRSIERRERRSMERKPRDMERRDRGSMEMERKYREDEVERRKRRSLERKNREMERRERRTRERKEKSEGSKQKGVDRRKARINLFKSSSEYNDYCAIVSSSERAKTPDLSDCTRDMFSNKIFNWKNQVRHSVNEIYRKLIFCDIEGDEKNPISFGLATMDGETMVGENELFMVPKIPPTPYETNKIHKMYVKKARVGDLVAHPLLMKKVVGGSDSVLQTVSGKSAADKILKFIESHSSKIILYHGQDNKTLDNFFQDQGRYGDFHSQLKHFVDTRKFFKKLQQEEYSTEKHGMATIVPLWASEEAKELYSKDCHSALTDAKVLANMCCVGKLSKRFGMWLKKELVK